MTPRGATYYNDDMLVSLKRIIRSGFVGFWRNAFVSFTSILVMVVALFAIATTTFKAYSLENILVEFQNRVDINLYFVVDAPLEEIEALKAEVETLPEVSEVVLTTQEEALEQFRLRHQNDELMLQGLEQLNDNPLGASLRIKANETSQYERIASFLEEKKEQETVATALIDRINFRRNEGAINLMTEFIEQQRQRNEVISIILIVIASFVMFNTVKLAIYNSREEIAVMRLVGASNYYITWPFLIVGIMQGLIAGVLVLGLLYPALLWDETLFYPLNFPGISMQEFLIDYFVSNLGQIFAFVVGGGVLISVVSSFVAVRKYLHV